MIGKKSEERRIVWWNIITMLTMVGLSFALINAEGDNLFYAITVALFLCVGIFVKRPYAFFSIMIIVLVFIIAKEALFGILFDENSALFNFNFFINSNN